MSCDFLDSPQHPPAVQSIMVEQRFYNLPLKNHAIANIQHTKSNSKVINVDGPKKTPIALSSLPFTYVFNYFVKNSTASVMSILECMTYSKMNNFQIAIS